MGIVLNTKKGTGGGGGGGVWGAITGDIDDQTDLQAALGLKAPLASPTFTNGISTGFVNSAAGALILRARDTPQFDTRLRTADGNVELFMAGSSGNASLTASANIELNATSIFSVLSDSVTVAANSFINISSSTSNTTVEAAGDLRLTGSAINFSSSVFQLNGNPVASNGSPTTIDQAFFLGGGTITIENGFVTVITP